MEDTSWVDTSINTKFIFPYRSRRFYLRTPQKLLCVRKEAAKSQSNFVAHAHTHTPIHHQMIQRHVPATDNVVFCALLATHTRCTV